MKASFSNASTASHRRVDPLGLGLMLFAGLNLNGVILLFLGAEAFLSPIILLLTIIMCIKYARIAYVTPSYLLFALTVASYLLFGGLAGILGSSFNSSYITSYGATILLVSAIHFWLASVDEAELTRILTILKNILLVSCVMVILSDVIRPYQVTPMMPGIDADQLRQGMESADRASGFFENPNEAAMIALYCIVLIAALPSSSLPLRLVQGAVAVVALIMTFSKAGMLTLLVLTALFLLTRRSFMTLVLSAVGLVLVFSGLWFVFENDLLNLSWEQRERLSDVLNLAGGEINERSTTGRNVLFEMGFEKITSNFPWGAGLGEFHAMEGGVRKVAGGIEVNEWLGIHNTFLMIAGEGGMVPLVMLLVFLLSLLTYGVSAPHRGIVYGFTIILMSDMMVSHHVLLLRFADMFLGVVLALLAFSPRHANVKYSMLPRMS
ncbi:O-antigen ligase family protein [Microvirga sp. GCM10011540]|uniref:O-antigen ligase family protein n=1 Tax=Microvirga sp. GCM10011540 TaxID=3317338 RepID=UPI00360FB3CD